MLKPNINFLMPTHACHKVLSPFSHTRFLLSLFFFDSLSTHAANNPCSEEAKAAANDIYQSLWQCQSQKPPNFSSLSLNLWSWVSDLWCLWVGLWVVGCGLWRFWVVLWVCGLCLMVAMGCFTRWQWVVVGLFGLVVVGGGSVL